ncbi:YcbK family protein [Pseudomonas mosselii]|uniref:YcbK family protein n=1 Tax=Pseudomonas mosselii TaxID=78327 RepID=UPI0021D7F7A0|nr:DUF882 domain-containing protein [Pseudomonas mosselii]MCU9528476.1 DUF882 domain-containing protein [Pseudomonas mosselii]MCU9535810.1 DUF882 domain-containing protein [Pseudomonas mosselii]MCU9543877.1 DUF882 domain-containing protein [Pseudomonas mosselii]MCU9550462.1 DUF882 domain-containing protein [Pseudomonas mosselii]
MSQETLLTRRQILSAAVAAPVAMATVPSISYGAMQRDWRAVLLDRDRFLDLERPQSGEKARFYYYRKGVGWDQNGYAIACTLLRDVVSKKTVQIDAKLLDLLWIASAYLRVKQLPAKILINSGYRTPEFNSSLEGAALNSMHVKAKAADIRIPGVGTEPLANLIKVIGVGGVGTYIAKKFVHLDVGAVRSWRGAVLLPHQDSWLAGYTPEDLDRLFARPDVPEHGRIVYA